MRAVTDADDDDDDDDNDADNDNDNAGRRSISLGRYMLFFSFLYWRYVYMI